MDLLENINDAEIFYEDKNYDNCVRLPIEIITQILVILEEHEYYENRIRHQERYAKVMKELNYYSSLPHLYMFDTPLSLSEIDASI